MVNRGGRGHEAVRDGDDLVLGTDTGGAQREMKTVGAVAHPDGEAGADERRDVRLEVTELAAEHQVAAGQDLADGSQDLAFHLPELLRVVHETDLPVHGVDSAFRR